MNITDLPPAKAMNLVGRSPGAFHQPGIRRKFLDPGETIDVFNLIYNRHRQDGSDSIDTSQKIVTMGIVDLYHPFDMVLQVLYDLIEVVEELKIRLHALPYRGDREVLSDPFPVLLPVQSPPDRFEVVLAVGILDVGQQLRPSSHKEASPPEQVPVGPHLPGIDISNRKHPAPDQPDDLLGIDFIVLGFSSVDGFHVESVPQDKGDALIRTEIGQPIPEEDTFDRNDNILSIGLDRLQENLRVSWEIFVGQNIPLLIDDAEIH